MARRVPAHPEICAYSPQICAIFLPVNEKRELLRHLLATLAYRASRTLENAPSEFADFGGTGRRPVVILAHMGDLMAWACSIAEGKSAWRPVQPLPWPQEQERFFETLGAFDRFLASESPIQAPIERLLQGPVADALTHVGQLAIMRRMAGSPTRGENFYIADIAAGQVSSDQPEPIRKP